MPALPEIGIRTTLWRPSVSPGVVLFFVIAATAKVIARQPAAVPRPTLACPISVFAVPGRCPEYPRVIVVSAGQAALSGVECVALPS